MMAVLADQQRGPTEPASLWVDGRLRCGNPKCGRLRLPERYHRAQRFQETASVTCDVFVCPACGHQFAPRPA